MDSGRPPSEDDPGLAADTARSLQALSRTKALLNNTLGQVEDIHRLMESVSANVHAMASHVGRAPHRGGQTTSASDAFRVSCATLAATVAKEATRANERKGKIVHGIQRLLAMHEDQLISWPAAEAYSMTTYLILRDLLALHEHVRNAANALSGLQHEMDKRVPVLSLVKS